MHELPIIEELFIIIHDTAKKHSLKKISGITMVIGELTGFVDDSLLFYFDHLKKKTVAKHAVLTIQRVSAIRVCLDCKKKTPVSLPLHLNCIHCGSKHGKVTGGDLWYIDHVTGE